MIDFLVAVLQAFWAIMKEASVYLLVGFLLAGVLAVLVEKMTSEDESGMAVLIVPA